ncbi:MAG: hypothetical protein HZB56_19260 [Deltaproteobacteria bacterium]|nr:hypothetical protein [Deltaproteobacteria bacterium]
MRGQRLKGAELTRAARDAALKEWDDPGDGRPPWLSILRSQDEDKDEVEYRVVYDHLAKLPHCLKTWLPKAREVIEAVEGPAGRPLQDIVDIVESIPTKEHLAFRRRVLRLLRHHLDREPTAHELAWGSILCGAEVEAAPKGSTVFEAINKEIKASRRMLCGDRDRKLKSDPVMK